MNKKTIIYISIGVVLLIILSIIIFISVKNNNIRKANTYYTDKVTLTTYNNDELINTIEITKKKKINELIKICENVSLEKDEMTEKLAIRDNIRVNLNNGIIFYVQSTLDTYCYLETKSIKSVIKMPENLLNFINDNIPQ